MMLSYKGEPILDRSFLDDFALLDPSPRQEMVHELIKTYFNHAPEQISKIKELMLAKKIQEIRKVAHALKSSSGNLGARRLSKICELLEQGDEAGFNELIAELDLELQQLREALAREYPKVA